MEGELEQIKQEKRHFTLLQRSEIVSRRETPAMEKLNIRLASLVQQGFQGQHVGSSLVAEGERWLQEHGIHSVIVNSGNTRIAAHRFYEHMGYQATGIRFVKENI
jgi:GNAT superfamily N-acetyltransferase